MRVNCSDVQLAQSRIGTVIRRTPLWPTTIATPEGPLEVLLKLEQLQISGTFKARGSFALALRLRDTGAVPSAGIAIASGGNAGIAAAIAGRHIGATVTVFVPTDSPPVKIARLKALNATVIEGGATHAGTQVAVAAFADETGAALFHPYDLPDVVAGAGTIALEIGDQHPEHGAIMVAVGGGGLVAGVTAVGNERGFTTVAIEPEGAPTLHEALKAGRPVPVRIDTIAADSLGASQIGDIAFDVCSAGRVASVLVSDAAIGRAREFLWDEYRLMVENSAAAPLAALRSGTWAPPDARPPVLVLCGANVGAQPGTL